MYNSTREFEACVLVNGKPVTEVVWRGQTYVEGRKKSTYELFFRNNSFQRVLVVPSVDGLSVINGEPAGKESPGYIVEAHSELVVPGWTLNGREAAEFIFHAQGAYYADEQTYVEEIGEDRRNQGVIGFMVFREKFEPFRVSKMSFREGGWGGTPRGGWEGSPTFGAGPGIGEKYGAGGIVRQSTTDAVEGNVWDHTNASNTMGISDANVSCCVDSHGNSPSLDINHVQLNEDVDEGKSLGTGFGDAIEFETRTVEFKREAYPCAVFAIHYDTLKNLRRIGVPVEQFNRHYTASYSSGPNPFPNSPELAGCTPPRGWTGRSGSRRRRKKTR